jgi:hypothetical protein
MKEIEECRNISERIFCRMVSRDRKVFKPRITVCRDIAGSVIMGKAHFKRMGSIFQ